MGNREFAALLYEAADLMELQGIDWKPQAYRKAARAIESLERDISDILKQSGRKELQEIPGVGEGIASHIEEFLRSGRVKKFDEVRKSLPPGIGELLELEGLGPKKAALLLKKLRVRGLADLKKALGAGKLRSLEGFGEKSEENLRKALELHERGKERMLLGEALPLAEELLDYLRPHAERLDYAGSLRRMQETIGDIDILAQSGRPSGVMEAFIAFPRVERVLAHGATKSSVLLREGIQVDLRVIPAGSYGAALQYFTGSKEHNVALRAIAAKRGLRLSEYGLFKGEKLLAGRSEEEVYRKLGFPLIPAEMREDRGELAGTKPPELVELRDMRGDLHAHTTFSDGISAVEEMALAAKSKGYEYLAITDHSQAERIARGLSEERLEEQWKELSRVEKRVGIRLLRGAEISIQNDGSLDYPERVLKKLEVTVCSIHSGFKMPKEKMTERILAALDNKYCDILGHPTGRLLNRRAPYEADMQRVFEEAVEERKILEVDGHPERLDLCDAHALAARKLGAKFSLSTDSHAAAHLGYMRFAVGQARRGWLTKGDVVNTLHLKGLRKVFPRMRD